MSPDRQDRIFVVSQGEIKGSFLEFKNQNIKIENTRYLIKKYGELFNKLTNGIDSRDYVDEGLYQYIRVSNVKDGFIIKNDIQHINYSENSRGILEKGTLLITRKGTVGESAVFNEDIKSIASSEIFVIKLNNNVNPYYFSFVNQLNFVKKQYLTKVSGGIMPSINQEALKEIKIPLPPLDIQQKIVEKMDNAITEKKRLESESEKILDSIEDYVLSELGIKLPKEQEEKNYFIVNIEDIENGRLDVFYNKPEFKEIEKCILNSNYEVHRLGEYINEIKYGASIKNNYSEKGIPFLRIKDIQANQINIDEMVYLDESERKNLGNCYVHEGDFLISRSGSIGIVALVDEKFEGFAYGSFMIKFNLRDDGLNKLYVSYRLNNKVNQIIIEKEKIGAIQQNITIDTIKDFYLPLPPKEIQDKIANEVKNRIEKAKQFKNQATEIYEQAKNEVEKMILE